MIMGESEQKEYRGIPVSLPYGVTRTDEPPIDVLGVKLRWAVDTAKAGCSLYHALVDDSGAVFSSEIFKDESVRMAKIKILTDPDFDRVMRFDEFSEIALVIPVTPGRGKTGEAKTGKSRYLVDDHESISLIKKEAKRAYETTNPSNRMDDFSKFLEQFVGAVLNSCSNPENTHFHLVSGKNVRPIVLVNQRIAVHSMNLNRGAAIRYAYDFYTQDKSASTDELKTSLPKPR